MNEGSEKRKQKKNVWGNSIGNGNRNMRTVNEQTIKSLTLSVETILEFNFNTQAHRKNVMSEFPFNESTTNSVLSVWFLVHTEYNI